MMMIFSWSSCTLYSLRHPTNHCHSIFRAVTTTTTRKSTALHSIFGATTTTTTRKSTALWCNSRGRAITTASWKYDRHLLQTCSLLDLLCGTCFRPEVAVGRENISNTERSCRSRDCELDRSKGN